MALGVTADLEGKALLPPALFADHFAAARARNPSNAVHDGGQTVFVDLRVQHQHQFVFPHRYSRGRVVTASPTLSASRKIIAAGPRGHKGALPRDRHLEAA